MLYNNLKFQTRESEDVDVLTLENVETAAKLIVYNDDVNTFDWVIECFVDVCQHSASQAEQLSYIVHFNGKATVKSGNKKELKPMKDALVDKGLSAVIED